MLDPANDLVMGEPSGDSVAEPQPRANRPSMLDSAKGVVMSELSGDSVAEPVPRPLLSSSAAVEFLGRGVSPARQELLGRGVSPASGSGPAQSSQRSGEQSDADDSDNDLGLRRPTVLYLGGRPVFDDLSCRPLQEGKTPAPLFKGDTLSSHRTWTRGVQGRLDGSMG